MTWYEVGVYFVCGLVYGLMYVCGRIDTQIQSKSTNTSTRKHLQVEAFAERNGVLFLPRPGKTVQGRQVHYIFFFGGWVLSYVILGARL